MIFKLVVGQLQTNCYLIYAKEGGECFVIDPGDDAGFIMNKIKDLDLEPKAILATHGHFDHVLAVAELKLAYNIPFRMSRKDDKILMRQQKTGKFFTGVDVDPAVMPDNDLAEGGVLKVDGLKLEVLETPGHTCGGVSFYCKEEGFAIVGDLIFKNGVGRTDLKGGDWEVLQKSISKVKSLPKGTIVYPGHGDKFFI